MLIQQSLSVLLFVLLSNTIISTFSLAFVSPSLYYNTMQYQPSFFVHGCIIIQYQRTHAMHKRGASDHIHEHPRSQPQDYHIIITAAGNR